MVRRLGVLIALLGIVAVTAGCMSQMSQALGTTAGCNTYGGCYGGGTSAQFNTYARTWARDLQWQQQFVDQYFWNYDVNNPYRCVCPIYDYCP